LTRIKRRARGRRVRMEAGEGLPRRRGKRATSSPAGRR